MSKSKGNVIEPQDIIEKYGADALRFWASGSTLGSDLDYREDDLVTGKKTVNKLWNASKFVFMNLEDYDGKAKPKKLEKIDSEFLKELDYTVKLVTEGFERYEYSVAKEKAERFFWDMFTDNYIEIVKKRVYNEKSDRRLSAQYTLYKSLLIILKMFAPIMPFITEEVYQTYFKKSENDDSIHVSNWPEFSLKSGVSDYFKNFCALLSKVRQEKTSAQKSMNSEIVLTLSEDDFKGLGEGVEDFKAVTNSREIKEGGEFGVEFFTPKS